jgi:hypothetical protein
LRTYARSRPSSWSRRGCPCCTSCGSRGRRARPRRRCAGNAVASKLPKLLGRALNRTPQATQTRPGARSWTRCLHDRARPPPRRDILLPYPISTSVYTRWSRSSNSCSTTCDCGFRLRLWLWLFRLLLLRLIQYLSHTSRAQEHAISLLAIEVPLSLNRSIIFARGFFQFYAHPFTRLEMHRADMAYDRDSAIVKLDYLTR